MMTTATEATETSETGLLTYEQLRSRWGVCRKQAGRVVRKLGIEPVRLGHRSVRFRLVDVLRAEAKAAGVKPARFEIR